MGAADVATVRESFDLFLSGDVDGAWSKWSRDAVGVSAPEWPERGVAEGLDEVIATFDGWEEAFGPDWPTRLRVDDYRDAGEGRILVEMSFASTGAGSGAPVQEQLSGIYTVRNGEIVKGQFFIGHEAGRRAAGLPAQRLVR
jgi:ketosteroid isomerase-like protein